LSEGPEYFILLDQPNDFGQNELLIRKEGHLWEENPVLQKYLGNKVLWRGEPIFTKHVKFGGTIKSVFLDLGKTF